MSITNVSLLFLEGERTYANSLSKENNKDVQTEPHSPNITCQLHREEEQTNYDIRCKLMKGKASSFFFTI